jgi:hypothetical protein
MMTYSGKLQKLCSGNLFVENKVTVWWESDFFSFYVSKLINCYNILTITSNHTRIIFAQSNSFFAVILQLPIPKTQIKFFCFQSCILAGWRLETRLNWTLLYNHFARTTQKTGSLLLGRRVYRAVAKQRKLLDCCFCIPCRGNMFTESLPSNGRLFWLYDFGRHVTISLLFPWWPAPGWGNRPGTCSSHGYL